MMHLLSSCFEYIFISNLISSVVTIILLLPEMLKHSWVFDIQLWKKMMIYATPLLIAGLAGITNETIDRIFVEKQKSPGDAEAVEGMGSISAHKGEHLMPTDHGIMVYRKHIRKSIKALQEGIDPAQPKKNGDIIKTYGQDTVLRVPKRNIDDRKFIKSIGSKVMKLQFDSEKMINKDRDAFIINELSNMEKNGAF